MEAAKKLKAIHQIVHELREEHTPDSDPQMVQALELVDTLTFQFLSAVKETFTTLYFPFMGQLARSDFAMQFKDSHTGKVNETRLATASEMKRKELGTACFGSTLLRHDLFAVHKTREAESAEAGLRDVEAGPAVSQEAVRREFGLE